MKNILEQQLKRLEQQEYKFLNQTENQFFKTKISPLVDMVQSKIPSKLSATLNTAFYKGFQLIFDKASPIIEKTYDKEKIAMDYDINNYAVDKWSLKRHIKRMDKPSGQSTLLNTSFSAVEGGVLGLLGIGLPDIPLFLSVVLKTIYEIALSYGYDYNTEDDKSYILLLICGAITKGDRQKEFDKEVEQLGFHLDHDLSSGITFDNQMKVTAAVMSDALLTAKFVQGLPIVGAIGGIVNYNISNRISIYSRIKYKKRYYKRKLME